jgi:membrane protease YdiL (CAAX protease family)
VALTILWPVVRGMPGRQWREYVGLVAPRGVWREIGAGLAGYYALLPVYVLVALVVIAIMFVISALTGAPPVPRNNGGKIAEVFGSSNPLIVVLVLTLATMWAPLVEETIFRGTLFRYWRARAGLFWGALGSAAVFAGMHGYIPMQLFMVGSLGFGFALIREWRGSTIGGMTAHCVHNAVVSIVMALILSLAA